MSSKIVTVWIGFVSFLYLVIVSSGGPTLELNLASWLFLSVTSMLFIIWIKEKKAITVLKNFLAINLWLILLLQFLQWISGYSVWFETIGPTALFLNSGLLTVTILLSQLLKRKISFSLGSQLLEWWNVVFITYLTVQLKFWSWCILSGTIGFDSQNFVTWSYTASKAWMPYRDVFYWYGLGTYFAEGTALIHITSLAWMFFTLVSWYFILKKATNNVWIAGAGWMLTTLNLLSSVGLGTWQRYGSSLVMGSFVAWTASQKVHPVFRFSLGFVIGSLIILIQDQGIYASLILAGTLFYLLSIGQWEQLKSMFWVCFGWSLGLLGWLSFLNTHNMMVAFFKQLVHTGELSLFAKISFYSSVTSIENLIIFAMIMTLGIDSILGWIRTNNKSHPTFSTILKIVWLGWLVLLQYKNITRRGMEEQFLYIIWGILALYSSSLIKRMRLKSSFKQFSVTVAAIFSLVWFGILLMVWTRPELSLTSPIISYYQHLSSSYPGLIWSYNTINTLNECRRSSLNSISSVVPQEYNQIVEWLKDQPDFSGRIFVWPETPLFYVLLNQLPAPVFNIYDATPISSQQRNIEFIERQSIKYVVLSTIPKPVQDGVPNELRSASIYQYLFTSFKPVKWFNSFVVLEKNQDAASKSNFVTDENLRANNEEYHTYLLNTEFRTLPQIWGKESEKTSSSWSLQTTPEVLSSKSAWTTLFDEQQITDRFIEIKIDTDSSIIETDAKPLVRLAIIDNEDNIATASFYPCFEESVCTIDKKFIPLFYDDRPVKKVEINTSEVGKVDQIFYRTTNTIPPSAANLEPRGSRQR